MTPLPWFRLSSTIGPIFCSPPRQVPTPRCGASRIRNLGPCPAVRDRFGFVPSGVSSLPHSQDQGPIRIPAPIARFESQPSYIDGGTFNNQPIGEAVRLSRQTAGFDFDEPRKYIFVNANSDNSVFRDHDVMKAITGDFLHLLERVAQIIFNQARVSDLLQALQINEQIVWRQQFLDTLVGLIQTVSVTDQPVFIQRLRDLAGSMVEASRARPGQRVGQTSLEDLLQRTRSKYAAWLQQIPGRGGPGSLHPHRLQHRSHRRPQPAHPHRSLHDRP